MDRLAKTWFIKRVIIYIKYCNDQEAKRLCKVRDTLATVRWEDLAPCNGCYLPYEKSKGVQCEVCNVPLACSRACDPWNVNECHVCEKILCHKCTDRSDEGKTYCFQCSSKSDSDVE